MSKMMMTTHDTAVSSFDTRRKLRRIRMIVALTTALISGDSSITYREASSLVDCAEKAINELVPTYRDRFELSIRPHFDAIIRERWPLDHAMHSPNPYELVN
jgi:hypothetical protein